MCQRLNTGESNNFYFGIFICIGPLIDWLGRIVCTTGGGGMAAVGSVGIDHLGDVIARNWIPRAF